MLWILVEWIKCSNGQRILIIRKNYYLIPKNYLVPKAIDKVPQGNYHMDGTGVGPAFSCLSCHSALGVPTVLPPENNGGAEV